MMKTEKKKSSMKLRNQNQFYLLSVVGEQLILSHKGKKQQNVLCYNIVFCIVFESQKQRAHYKKVRKIHHNMCETIWRIIESQKCVETQF